jgi:hypothetical protein
MSKLLGFPSEQSITVKRGCCWCGAEVETSLNHGTQETSVKPIITAFNKLHRRTGCKGWNQRDAMETRVTTNK